MVDTIFKAIRYGLNNKTIDFEINDEKAFSKAIFENGLIGIIVPSLSKDTIKDEKLYKILLNALNEYIVVDTKQIYYIDKIKNALNDNEIKFIFLKGSHLKQIYPKSHMRGMGDIDVIVKSEDLEKVSLIFKNLEFKQTGKTTHHITYETIDNVEIELHNSVLSELESNDSLFNNIWEYTNEDNNLILGYELVYLVKHLARHTRSSGIGIRSILDIEIFERYYKDDINYDKVYEFLKLEKLDLFYNKIKEINTIILNNKKYDENTKKTLNYLFKSGIHGSGSNYNPFVSRSVYQFKGGKFKYYFGMAFPSYKIMKGRYKSLKYVPFLLPIYYVVRWISFIFKGSKSIKKRRTALNEKELIQETVDVLNYFGLNEE